MQVSFRGAPSAEATNKRAIITSRKQKTGPRYEVPRQDLELQVPGLRQHKELKNIKQILMSSQSPRMVRRERLQLQMNHGYIGKPSRRDINELLTPADNLQPINKTKSMERALARSQMGTSRRNANPISLLDIWRCSKQKEGKT